MKYAVDTSKRAKDTDERTGQVLFEALPWITYPLYGHAAWGAPLVGLMVVCGLLGVRGARALKKGFAQDAEVFA